MKLISGSARPQRVRTLHNVLLVFEGLAGAGLVAAVLSDVFRSVVLPSATRRTLRVGPLLGMLLLPAWLAWTKRQPATRHAVLGALGPLLLIIELVIWVTLLMLGYGLVLHALRSGIKPEPGLLDALYASGAAFLTLGLSGQEAVTAPVRFVVILAGGTGLTIVTLVVTFLLSVQSALHRREVLVVRLRERTGPHPSGLTLLEQHAKLSREHDAALREFFKGWEEWSADVLLTHRAFPVLVYFRSTDEDCEWLTALGAVLDAAALAAVVQHDGAAEHAMLCHRMGARLARELADQFGMHPADTPGLDRAAFIAGLRRLERAGYCPGQDEATAWGQFQTLRAGHQPSLQALTRRFGVAAAAW